MNPRHTPIRRSARPRLELLEDRLTPTVTTSFSGHTLSIVSNGNGGTAIVTANANESISVTSAGTTKTFSGVDRINANLTAGAVNAVFIDLRNKNDVDINILGGNGRDTVGIGVGSTDTGDDHNVTANLGNGINTFTYRAIDVGEDDGVDLRYTGGTGADNVNLQLGVNSLRGEVDARVNLGDGANTFQASSGLIDEDADLSLNLTGGSGTDAATLTFSGLAQNSQTEVDANLGAGNDTFRETVGFADRDAENDLNLDTGAGNDAVFLTFRGFGDNSETNLDVKLGDGNDTIAFAFPQAAQRDADISLDLDGGAGTDSSNTTGINSVINNIDVSVHNMESVKGTA